METLKRTVAVQGPVRTLAALFAMAALAALPLAAGELDQHGKEHVWRGKSGSVTVLDFAASWCAPCIKSLPRLEKLATEYPDVRFLVISVDKKESGRDYLVEELDLRLPVLWDHEYRIAEYYRPESMPSTLVLDAEGNELYRHAGFTEASWRDLIAVIDSH